MERGIGSKLSRWLGIMGLFCAGTLLLSEQNCCFAAESLSYFTEEAYEGVGTEIILYSGETMLGAYTDAACAKAALNALIEEKKMTERTGNIGEESQSSASTSNAARGTASNATGSNAALYDEDGLLLDGLVSDDLTQGVLEEEANIPDSREAFYSEEKREADRTAIFFLENRRREKTSTKKHSSDHSITRHRSNHGGSGEDGSQTEETVEIAEPKISEPVPLVQKNTENIQELSRKRVGLPWGRIGRGKEDPNSGIPKTGEERGTADFLVSGALIWSIVVLLYLLCGEMRRDKRIERRRGK